MTGHKFFDVSGNDLSDLAPERAVDIFRRLLWVEARRLGLSHTMIDVPSAITVADGGVDAEVNNPTTIKSSLIQAGLTRYQIKTGTFSAGNASEIRSLIENRKGEILPRVRSCLEKDGRFVVVLFGSDMPDRDDNTCVERLREHLARYEEKYRQARLEVWRQNQLRAFLEPFPSLCLHVNRRDGGSIVTHEAWAAQDMMRRDFHPGPRQLELLNEIAAKLRGRTEACHVHIGGEAGIGKTRLALEGTRDEDLEPTVLYCASGESLLDGNFLAELGRGDNCFDTILVVDECDSTARAGIWNRCKHLGPRVALVTIFNEVERTTGRTHFVHVEPLPDDRISEIIQGYGVARYESGRWAGECGGSPRVAHMVGMNLREHPGDVLREPDTEKVWDRYIDGSVRNAPNAHRRRLVLQHLALFKRFGLGPHFQSEQAGIAGLIKRADPQLFRTELDRIIQDYRESKVLQGENTLYITPKLLHIKLWCDWWKNYGGTRPLASIIDDLLADLPASLADSFYEMLEYSRSSAAASKVMKELLGTNGPFVCNPQVLDSARGSRLFLACANADPEAALSLLKATVGTWSLSRRRRFSQGRRSVVFALERIAVWRDNFQDAARILLLLAEAENEEWVNNATGTFAELFSLALAPVAPTEAEPSRRLVVLNEALKADSKACRMAGIRACKSALRLGHGSRTIGREYQGLRKSPDLWMPKTYGELWNACSDIWEALHSALPTFDDDERREAARVFVESARHLVEIPTLFNTVIDTFKELRQHGYVNTKELLHFVAQTLRFRRETMRPEHVAELRRFRDDLTGTSFDDHLKRFVGMQIWEEDFNEEENVCDRTRERIIDLAQRAVDSPEVLKPHFEWLVRPGADNSLRFGYEVGKRDGGFRILPSILEAQKEAGKDGSPYFLGGYLRAMAEVSPGQHEPALDQLAADPATALLLPELSWRSGLSDAGVLRICELLARDAVDVRTLAPLGWGKQLSDVSSACVEKVFRELSRRTDPTSACILLDLADSYYVRGEDAPEIPEEIAAAALTHPGLFRGDESTRRDNMPEFYWARLAKVVIERYPELGPAIAEKVIEHFEDAVSVLGRFRSNVREVLALIIAKNPEEVWGFIARALGPPVDARAVRLEDWLRGDRPHDPHAHVGALGLFPHHLVWEWIEADIERRAPYCARLVPPSFSANDTSVTRGLLVRYGDRQSVRNGLFANLSSGTWWGPTHVHLQQQRDILASILKREKDSNVRRWLEDFLRSLDDEIPDARVRDEREAMG